MKRILSALTLTLIFAGAAFGLSDSEYLRLKKSNADFASADRELTRVYKRLQNRLPGWAFKILREEQREWISGGRDDDAESYMDQGYSRAEAYTMATNDRAEYLPRRARQIVNGD